MAVLVKQVAGLFVFKQCEVVFVCYQSVAVAKVFAFVVIKRFYALVAQEVIIAGNFVVPDFVGAQQAVWAVKRAYPLVNELDETSVRQEDGLAGAGA